MIEVEIKIQNVQGIHIRPATEIVKQIRDFKSDIYLTKGEQTEDIKNIVNLVSLQLCQGTICILRCSGEDELKASQVAQQFLEKQYPF